jgi:hypothetical protein
MLAERFARDSPLEERGFELAVPDGGVDPKLLDPVCRLSGSGYAALGDLVSVQRPQWKDIKGTIGMDAMPRAQRR